MRTLPIVGVVAGLAILPLTVASPAEGVGTSYVALGDSYSAGVGTRNKVDACYRSPEGYPALVAGQRGWSLNYQACSGATIGQVEASQLAAVTSSVSFVTVSAGGNDAGFADGLLECAKPGWMSNCPAKLDTAERLITGTIPARLDSLYGKIRSQAPNARRAAVGYPHIFNGEDCNALTWFSPAEQSRINQLTDKLDQLTATRAAAHGMGFVDPRGSFAGHAVCDSTEFINGLAMPVEESYHPNDAGNRAYATLVSGALGATGATRTISAAGSTLSTASTPTAESYAALVPDLATEKNLARAEAAGLNRGQIKKLDRELRSGDLGRAKKAFGQLKQLDRQVEKKAAARGR